MQIYLRISKGCSKPVENRGVETCDLCGAKLWIGPGNQIYCDQLHSLEIVASLPKPAITTTIKY
jgi:hypothetical protein